MENESHEILKRNLIQLKKARVELINIKRLLRECIKGFETIRDTGNTKVAEVFLEELNNEINGL